MTKRVFVGFGFGAIQGGLFLYEAQRSGNFGRLVVAEVVPEVVAALRHSHGRYRVNVATPTGVERHEVGAIEVFNPNHAPDRKALVAAVAEADEVCTALPSVDFYDRGEQSLAALLAEGFTAKLQRADAPAAVVYTAENHNHAAELLEAAVRRHVAAPVAGRLAEKFQALNTVIGKMSRVVLDLAEIRAVGLAMAADTIERAFLVEEFNRILISRIRIPGFQRGITVFEEKDDLLPFEEAKLYGHNATHALLGYLAQRRGYAFMSEAGQDQALMTLARAAFLEESGRGLLARRQGIDPLFTPAGYQAYVEDLLVRMVNPHLRDAVARVTRDPRRKLAWDDRLVGTMRVALDAGVVPLRYAQGAAAAVEMVLADEPPKCAAELLDELWAKAKDEPHGRKAELKKLIGAAAAKLG